MLVIVAMARFVMQTWLINSWAGFETMRLVKARVQNYRSIRDSGEFEIDSKKDHPCRTERGW